MDLPSDQHGEASYIIFEKDGDILARNGESGNIEFSRDRIQDVLGDVDDALPSSGGKILIKNGTYLCYGTYSDPAPAIKMTTPNLLIAGEGWGTVLKVADGTTDTDEGINLLAPAGDNVTLRDLQIYGNYENNTPISGTSDGYNIHPSGANFSMYNVLSQHATGDGVESLSDGANIRGNRFIENNEHNVHIHGNKDVMVANNILESEQGGGCIAVWVASGGSDTRGLTIADNVLRDNQAEGIKLVTNTKIIDAEITGNTVVNSGGMGIELDAASLERVKISDNTVVGNDVNGIRFRGPAETLEISDNLIELNGANGIHGYGKGSINTLDIKDNLVRDNNQNDTDRRGILLDNVDYDWYNIEVEGNRVISTSTPYHYHGIQTVDSGTGTLTDAYVRRNLVRNVQGAWHRADEPVTSHYKNCPGPWKQSGTANFAIDSTGVKSFPIGYSRITDDSQADDPTMEDMQLSVARVDAVSDWAYDYAEIQEIRAGGPCSRY